MADYDLRLMDLAVRLGDRQLGLTGENPAVGCVIAREDRVIGIGATGDGGRPHAEQLALEMAGDTGDTKGADAYVTLEPCAHQGKTPPCAEALVKAGIRRVISPWQDPDARVGGRGFQMLRQAGIELVHPVMDALPYGLRPFMNAKLLGRPFVSLKLATSMDGKIALGNGKSQWISSEEARRHTGFERARNAAIAVGIGTVLADNPKLTARINGVSHNPKPVIFDSELRISPKAAVLKNDGAVIFHACEEIPKPLLEKAELIKLRRRGHGLDLEEAMEKLAQFGVTSLLVEGGAKLAASFLRAGLVDRFLHVTTGAIIGADGLDGVGALALEEMKEISRMAAGRRVVIGDDTLIEYEMPRIDLKKLRPLRL